MVQSTHTAYSCIETLLRESLFTYYFIISTEEVIKRLLRQIVFLKIMTSCLKPQFKNHNFATIQFHFT